MLFSLLCGCTTGAAIPSLTATTTRQNFGEVVKVIFQRRLDGATLNEFVIGTTDPKLKGSWTTLKAASDGTKAIFSPYTEGYEGAAGSAIKFGGTGQTTGGIQRVVGKEPTQVKGTFFGAWQSTIRELDGISCEDLTVFLVNECGHIAGVSDDPTNPTTFKGFPIAIQSLFIADKTHGKQAEDDANAFEWTFKPNWSKYFTVLAPTDFNPVDDADLNTIA